MFSVRKRSANVAAAANVFCAKAKRQRQDVGHTSVFTGVKVLACVPL
ncbi:hypothetical protein ACIQXF_06290 [Lysinibacillus sp. NPDC097231]